MSAAEMDEARRWTALRGWRWMPGMRAVTPTGDFAGRLTEATLGIARPVYPDITDPATRGCLLALHHEITGEDCAHPRHDMTPMLDGGGDPRWAIMHKGWPMYAPTYTAALLAACEHAEFMEQE